MISCSNNISSIPQEMMMEVNRHVMLLQCNAQVWVDSLWECRMLHSVRSEPSRFGMAAEHVEELDRAVNDMDNVLITGLFQVPYSSHPCSFQLDTMNIKSMVVQGCCCCKSPQVVACWKCLSWAN